MLRVRRAWRARERQPKGVNVKALSEYMGHASIVMTMDRYGHLLPGNEAEAAGLLDAYLTSETKGA